jgi:hypothetical protein
MKIKRISLLSRNEGATFLVNEPWFKGYVHFSFTNIHYPPICIYISEHLTGKMWHCSDPVPIPWPFPKEFFIDVRTATDKIESWLSYSKFAEEAEYEEVK